MTVLALLAHESGGRHAELGSKRNFQRPWISTGLIHLPCNFLLIIVIVIICISRGSKSVGPYQFQVIIKVLSGKESMSAVREGAPHLNVTGIVPFELQSNILW